MSCAAPSRTTIATLTLLALLLWPVAGRGQLFRSIVNPKTYTSPSGTYTVTVDPEDRQAEGGATVTIRRQGQQVWSGKMAFTLLNAGITDDGAVGGYGFSRGKKGRSDLEGDFHVVLLDSRGKIRLDQQTPRQQSRFLDHSPDPNPEGLILDPEDDRLVVRVADPDINRGIESWWIYRLSTATPLTKIEPRRQMEASEPTRYIIDAQHVAGTPLTLLHWWRFDRSEGARFTLIDPVGKPVWSLELPEDYQSLNEDERDRIQAEIRANGAILRTDQAGSFDLRFVAAAQRVHFTVTRAPDGSWEVVERGRTPYTPADSRPSAPAIPTQRLTALGTITFPPEFTAAASPVRNLEGFVIAGSDRFAFLRREAKGPDTFVVVNTAGKLIHQVRLDGIPIAPKSDWSGYLWAGGDRFLLTRSELGGKGQAWYLDAASGAITPLAGFECPPIKRIAAFPQGGFITLNTVATKYTMWEEMYAFDAQGKQIWCQKGGNGYSSEDGPERLFSPEDLTVTPDGKVAVLDNIALTVQIYAGNGRFLKRLDLEKAWRRKPEYPTNIVPDANGGFLIFDFPGKPSIVRTYADGKIRVGVPLPASAAQENGTLDEIRIGSDGKIWVSDGHYLKRLTDAGKVDRVLGDRPDAAHMGRIDKLKMLSNGRIYALDSRAGAVHLFDETGKHLSVRRSGHPDASLGSFASAIHVLENGELFLRRKQGILHFSASGERIKIGGKSSAGAKRHNAAANRHVVFWDEDRDSLAGVDREGFLVRNIERLPNRDWIPMVLQSASDTRGALAVLTAPFFQGDWRISLYTPDGAPLRSFPLPETLQKPYGLAFDGSRVVVGGKGKVVVFDTSGKALWEFSPELPGEQDTSWQAFLVHGGKELRLYDGVRTIHRYTMP